MSTVSTESDLRGALLHGGDITVDAELDLHEPLQVSVPGTRVRGGHYRAASGPAWTIRASGVTLAELDITGGRQDQWTVDHTQRLVHAVGTQDAPLQRVLVRDCTIRESRGDAVRLEWCTDTTVRACDLLGVLYGGVMVLSGLRARITGNLIMDAPLSDGVVNSYGVALTDATNTEAGRSRHCRVTGNTIVGVWWEGIDSHGGDGLLIADNEVIGCPRGIALVTGNEARLQAPTRCQVVGNSIRADGMALPQREAIFLGGLEDVPADALITGNHISGYARPFNTNHFDRRTTWIGANNVPAVPWTRVDMSTSAWQHNAAYPLEYMVDGDQGRIRGGAIRKYPNAGTYIGHLRNAHAWPSILTWIAHTKGSNANAGEGTMIVHPDGALHLAYPTDDDGYTMIGTGIWQAV